MEAVVSPSNDNNSDASPPGLVPVFSSLMTTSKKKLPPTASERCAFKHLYLPPQSQDRVAVQGCTAPGKTAYITIDPRDLFPRYDAGFEEPIFQVPTRQYRVRPYFLVNEREGKPFAYMCNTIRNFVTHLQGISTLFGSVFEYGRNVMVLHSTKERRFLVILMEAAFQSPEKIREFFLPYFNRATGVSPFDQYEVDFSRENYTYKTPLPMPGGVGVEVVWMNSDGAEITDEVEITAELFSLCFVTAFTPVEIIPVGIASPGVGNEEASAEEEAAEAIEARILRLASARDPGLYISAKRPQPDGSCIFDIRKENSNGFGPWTCPGGVDHRQGCLIAQYMPGGLVTFRCALTGGDECPVIEVGTTSDADEKVRFIRYLRLLRKAGLDRADLPLTSEEYARYTRTPQEIFEEFFPDGDFHRDFVYAPPPDDPREKAIGFSLDLMLDLIKDDIELAVTYFNLYVNIIPHDQLFLRGGRVDRYSWLKNAAYGPVCFYEQKGKKEVKRQFTEFWLGHRGHRIISHLERRPLDGKFDLEVLNSTPLPLYDLSRAREIVHDVSLRPDFLFCEYVWERICEFVVDSEEPAQKDLLSDLFELWVLRVLFQFNVPVKVMLVLNSSEGGTGKSSVANLVQAMLGPANFASMTLKTLTGTTFNSDFDKACIVCDEDAYSSKKGDRKKDEALKALITQNTVTVAKKYASNAITRLTNTSYMATVNGAESQLLAGVNSNTSGDRRFLMLSMAAAERQDAILSQTGFNCYRPTCQASVCVHRITSSAVFWYIFNDKVLKEFLPVMTAVLFERFNKLQKKYPFHMHLLLQDTASKLLAHQQSLHQSPVSKWFNDGVRQGYLFDLNDPAFAKITLLLPDNVNPETVRKAKDRWIKILPLQFLFTIYNKTDGAPKLTQDDFELQLLSHLKKLKPTHTGPMKMSCHFYALRIIGFDERATAEWVQTSGESEKMCVRLPKTLLVPGKRPAKGSADIRRSLSNFDMDQTPSKLGDDASIVYSQSPDDSSLAAPDMDILGGDDAMDGEGEPADAEDIPFNEEVSAEEEPNSDDELFIDDDDDEDEGPAADSGKRARPPTRTKERIPKKRVYADDEDLDIWLQNEAAGDKGKGELDE